MGVKERKARQKKYLRQEILDAASELFVRDGYENVSMRRIADKIEYSPTTIYLYFKDKAELLDQVCKETFGRLVQRLSKSMDQPGDPVERLKRGLIAYIEFGLQNPHHYRATFMMPFPEGFDHEKHHKEDSPGMQAFAFLTRGIEDCINAGNERRVGRPDAVGGDSRDHLSADHALHVSVGGEGQSHSFHCRYAGSGAGGVEGKFFCPNINSVHLTSSVTFFGDDTYPGQEQARWAYWQGGICFTTECGS